MNFNQTDTTTFSAALIGSLSVNQKGTGTTILTDSNSYTGNTTVNAGTLVLDYTANDDGKLSDGSALFLGSGTLQLDRSSGASGSHVEVVGSTILYGAANVTRGVSINLRGIGSNATLELDPRQAETITLAQRTGQLSLPLRSLLDAIAEAKPEDMQPDAKPDDKSITIIRYGVSSSARPK